MRSVRESGFTFVELLVTLTLIGLVGAATVAMLAGGIRVWERTQGSSVSSQQMQLAFETMRRDLHNSCLFHPIPFEGAYDTFSFPAKLERETAQDGSVIREVGRLGYYLNEREGLLCRSKVPYRLLRSSSLRDSGSMLVSGVERLRFSYYALDPVTGRYEWKQACSEVTPPLAVKIEVGYRLAPKKPLITQSLVVYLPTAKGDLRMIR